MGGRRALTLLAAATALAGCYGSTEPATDIRSDSARLNARGTADHGPAYSFFRVRRGDFPFRDEPFDTPTRTWPAGASGPISERVAGLVPSSSYSFQLCGGDEGEPPACANERSFIAPGPEGQDSVEGSFLEFPAGPSAVQGGVDARSGTAGTNPRGSLSFSGRRTDYVSFTGFVTCLRIRGTRAIVGAIGQANGEPATALVAIEDIPIGENAEGDPEGDRFGISQPTPGSAPPDCGVPFPQTFRYVFSDVIVTDNLP